MRIDSQLSQNASTSVAMTQANREVPGEREADGDADDTAKVAAQQKPMNQIQSDSLGKKVNVLA